MKKIDLYIENLSVRSFFFGIISANFFTLFFQKKINNIYFIDQSFSSRFYLIQFLSFFVNKIQKLDFKMANVKDKNRELIRTRIHRFDLFNLQKKIIDSKEYKYFYNKTWDKDRVTNYLQKGLIEGSITKQNSYSRILFIVNVVHLHSKSGAILIANDRAWFDILVEYALDLDIQLINGKVKIRSLYKFKKYIVRFPNIYALLVSVHKKSLSVSIKNIFKDSSNASGKIFIDGRGDLNCSSNGYHSDFFMCQNSKLSYDDITYKAHTKNEFRLLEKCGINPVYESGVFRFGCKRNYKVPKIRYLYKYRKEYSMIKTLLYLYDLERFNWSIFFKKNNIKIYNTWFKYSSSHMAISDAIKDNNGIATTWQMAFDGFHNFENIVYTDIQYVFSKFDLSLNKSLGSKAKISYDYGYPRDYSSKIVFDEAQKIRKHLKSNGVKKIIFSIDENSLDDYRWHTGHDLQRDNYSYILKEVLSKSWLGVVFKPKNYITLRKRLGSVNDLLIQAELTGRCYIFKESGRYTTSAPPILAGLSADVCIHGHLNAGTAALECAIEGIPTLLIDREGAPYSILNKLGREVVVFKDWSSAIEATMSYFQDFNSIPGFGSWSNFLKNIELVSDGKSADRIGNNLHEMLELCNKNYSRKEIFKTLKNKIK